MQQIHKDRLLRLRYLMQNLALETDRRASDIGVLSHYGNFDIQTIGRGTATVDGCFCPTVCCVIGAAACDPILNTQGLTSQIGAADERGTRGIFVRLNGWDVEYDGPELAEFFGLSQDQYFDLVNVHGYEAEDLATPHDVIELIDEYLGSEAAVGEAMPQPVRDEPCLEDA